MKHKQIDNSSKLIILTLGISGSGKSTWVKTLQHEYIVISPDEIRLELTGNMSDKSKDIEVYNEVNNRTELALNINNKVIIDSTNLQKKRRRNFIANIQSKFTNVNFYFKLFELSPKIAKSRIKLDIDNGVNRANVPDSTIDRHVLLYKEMLNDIKNEPLIEIIDNKL